jgi:hypothetical protein
MIQVIYIPENQRYSGEYFNSYTEYKRDSADRWTDEFGDERLPEFTVMTLAEFESGIRDVQCIN